MLCFATLRAVAAISLLALLGSSGALAKGKGQSAFLQSLILPGWGQYSLGQKNAALGFAGAELAMIGGLLALNEYGSSTRDDYIAMARNYAGVQGDHEHDYYVDVGNWMTTQQFNDQRLREREFNALYRLESEQWSWQSEEQRGLFKKIRIRSDRAFNNMLYLVGGLVLNHITSGIHAGRSAVSLEKKSGEPSLRSHLDFRVKPLRREKGAKLGITYHF